jgi:RepB DNA-primase from phage plasmid/AAA domain
VTIASAARFLSLLDEDAERFTFQMATDAEPKPKPDPLARHCHLAPDNLEQLESCNNAGAAVWVMINAGDGNGRAAANVERVRSVFVDGDGQVSLAQLLGAELEPHIVTETSPGHLQGFRLVDGLSIEQFAGVQRQIARQFGTDSICDPCRVMRVPGFRHQKNPTKPFQVRIVHERQGLPYKAEDILRAWPPIRPKANGKAANGSLPLYPSQAAINALLRDPTAAAYWSQKFTVTPGVDRSPSGWDLAFAGYLASTGLSRDEIAGFLRAYRAHHEPTKGKQDRASYIFATVDQAIGEAPENEDATFGQNDNDLHGAAAAQPTGRKGATLEPKPTDWLWHPYFPAGELSLIGAKGGVGKGQACASIVARLTTGIFWPDGKEKAPTGHILWAEAEDSIEKTVIPRLIANAADRGQVTFFNEEEFATLDLRRFVQEQAARAIILSPIMAFLPKLKSHIDELAVRAELKKLRAAVDGTLCALIGIAHLNKKTDLDAVERLLGSVAFANFVRSVVLLASDKENDGMRRWVHAKHNLSVRGGDLLFQTRHVGEDPKDQFVKVEWEIPSGDDIDVNSFFDRKPHGDRKPSATDWLLAYLDEHGESLAKDVMEAGVKAGYSADTLRQAQFRNNRIGWRREGFPSRTWWSLK